jgi:SAM-dependent methyltransferase
MQATFTPSGAGPVPSHAQSPDHLSPWQSVQPKVALVRRQAARSHENTRHGRPAYSPELEAVLAREAGLDGSGRLLDVGCGPGVLAVRLAHLFGQAVGLDPDADMLAEGCRAAGGN